MALLWAALLLYAPMCWTYSVLTHEVVVDLLWADNIEPLLRQQYPQATADELREAHAYAYGGAIIQDLGYYPFGSKDFSDLVHYVRSGDFVRSLVTNATDLNELAFALGALSHYAADTEGHPAINRSVADEIPKLRARFGPAVTYAEDPKAHIRVEFGFDVAQVAKQRFPSSAYHDFIGFKVCKPLLERAFRETYGIELHDVIKIEDLAIGTYRRAVSKVIPMFTRAALATHRADLVREIPNFDRKKFLYTLSRAQYEQEWGRQYERPGIGARILAFIVNLLPKKGPFKAADFKPPTPQTEDLYFKSVNSTVERFRAEIKEVGHGSLVLPNRDFDTGKVTKAGEYPLTDDAYAKLVRKLADKKFDGVTPALRANILEFFADPNANYAAKRHRDKWRATLEALRRLKSSESSASSVMKAPEE